MRLFTFGAAFSVLATAPAGGQAPAWARLDALLADVAAPDTPGCAVGVARGGQVLLRRSRGLAELEHRVPLTSDSILEAGSVAKQFTAAAIVLLAEDGTLSLSDDVRKHVPDLPDYGHRITIGHLLSHTSGLRDWGVVAEIEGWPRGTRALSQDDALAIIRRQRSLNYPPGSEYGYTNSGYNLLAHIVARVSGQSLAAFTRERIFVPLGMTDSSWRDDFRRIVPRRATAYSRRGDGFAQDMPFEDAHGNGGLLTTVADLSTWNAAMAAGRLGPRVSARLEETARLSSGAPITYARGLFVDQYRGLREVAHSGATGGYRAWLGRYPAHGLSVALLCNRGDVDATAIGRQVADLFLPPDQEPAPDAAAPDAGTGLAAAGMFVNQSSGRAHRVAVSGGQVTIDGRALSPAGPNLFRHDEGELRFLSADRFRNTDRQGQSAEFRRVEPASPAPADLARYVGRYASDEANATYRVALAGGELKLSLDNRPHKAVTLKPTYRHAFEAEAMVVRFRPAAGGRIAAMSLGLPRVRDMRFVRVAPR